MFDNVTILFSDVVGFTRICSQISPMEVVSMLNAMYTQFDQLSEKHNVYKVSIYFISIIKAKVASVLTENSILEHIRWRAIANPHALEEI